jgi:hypothetical protein
MNIESIKLDLVQDILKVKDERILKGVQEFLSKINKVTEPEPQLYPMTLEELNARIDAAEEDFKYRRVTDINDFLKEME